MSDITIGFCKDTGEVVEVQGRLFHEVENDPFIIELFLQAMIPLAKRAGATEVDIDGEIRTIVKKEEE